MSHITAKRLEQCWDHLRSAEESLYKKDTPFDALRDCRLALEDLYDAAVGQHLQQEQVEESKSIENEILELRKRETLRDDEVEAIIHKCGQAFDNLRGPILASLHASSELDYEPTPDLEDDLKNYSLNED